MRTPSHQVVVVVVVAVVVAVIAATNNSIGADFYRLWTVLLVIDRGLCSRAKFCGLSLAA